MAELFGERYELISQLDGGGMGSVYKARHLTLDQIVAVKVVHDGESEAAKRLLKEARALASLSHPHIVRVLSVEMLQGDLCALVMEYVDGANLAAVIAAEGRLSAERCRNIMMQIADALSEAHRFGIVHRDLKPENILLSKNPDGSDTIKVLDFGIAKILSDDSSQRITTTGALIGSPSYMSPEQCQAKPADQRSDIYSLGCVMYEALTGKKPVTGESAYEVVMKHVEDRIPAPETSDKGLAGVVIKCTERNPDDRFQTADEVLTALGRHSFTAVPVIAKKAPAKRNWLVPVIALSAVVAMLAIAAFSLSTNNPAPVAVPTTPAISYKGYNAARLAQALIGCYRNHERPSPELIEAVSLVVNKNTDTDDLRTIAVAYQELWYQRREREYAVLSRKPLEILIDRSHQSGKVARFEVYPLVDSYLPREYKQARAILDEEIRFCESFNDDKRLQIPSIHVTMLAAAFVCGEQQEVARLRKLLEAQFSSREIESIVQFQRSNPIIKKAKAIDPNFLHAAADNKRS